MEHPIYASEFVIYSVVNEAGWNTLPHAHQCFELLYVVAGRCHIVTAAGSSIAQPHDLILFRPYQWHKETQLSDVYAVVCLRIPSEFVAAHRVPLPEPAVLPTVTPLPHNEAFRAILDQIIAEYQQHDRYSAAMIGAYLFQFAVLLQRTLQQHGAGASATEQAQVAGLRDLLDQHITSTTSIRDLARLAHMSESHFSHQVKALLGMAPKTYVREQRIARARELLRSTALSIEEIAAELGYDEPTSFFRAFKRATGLTPGAFRRAN